MSAAPPAGRAGRPAPLADIPDVATKTDVQAVRTDLLTVEARLNARIDFVEHRLLWAG